MAVPADTTFCKRLAVGLWGLEDLAKKSTTGSASNKVVSKGNKTVFPALTLLKVAGLSCRSMLFCASSAVYICTPSTHRNLRLHGHGKA